MRNVLKKKCWICGRNATGVHYGVIACEGCKAFYRRNVGKKRICLYGNNCATNSNTQMCCKACRFRKCQTLGMKIQGPKLIGDRKKKEKLSENSENRGGSGTTSGTNIECSSVMIQTDPLNVLKNDSVTEEDHIGVAATKPIAFGISEFDGKFGNDLFLPNQCKQEQNGISSFQMAVCSNFLLSDCHVPEVPDVQQRFSPSNGARRQSDGSRVDCPSKIVDFMWRYMDVLDNKRRLTALTVQSVSLAIDRCFGDQISQWQTCMDSHLKGGDKAEYHQPQTTKEKMIEALRQHNLDSVVRIQKFAAMLPGINDLDVEGRRTATIGWKWRVFWLIHHAPYMTEDDSYVSSPEGIRYCRYWQSVLSERPLLQFIYKFSSEFREIGLTQTESYMLLAVILFEPGSGMKKHPGETLAKLELIHRHYTDVLFECLKRRSRDAAELTETVRKLERFFGGLELVYRLHRNYFRSLDLGTVPFRSIKGQRQVSVMEALRAADAHDEQLFSRKTSIISEFIRNENDAGHIDNNSDVYC